MLLFLELMLTEVNRPTNSAKITVKTELAAKKQHYCYGIFSILGFVAQSYNDKMVMTTNNDNPHTVADQSPNFTKKAVHHFLRNLAHGQAIKSLYTNDSL